MNTFDRNIVRQASTPQLRIFSLAVPAQERALRVTVSRHRGEFHDVFHARALRGVDKVALEFDDVLIRRRVEQRAIDAFHRRFD